jgi:ERCC4-type nuclease
MSRLINKVSNKISNRISNRMPNIVLTIDARERAVIPFFKESYQDIELDVKQIQIGDYIISQNNKILMAIERKSWRDLSGSIKDGRIENVNKLMSLRDKTDCKLIYLIEGKARCAPQKRYARIPYKSLLAHLDHLMIRDNIHIIYSNDEEDTSVRLIELCANYLTLNIRNTTDAMDVDQESPAQNEQTAQNEQMQLLTTVIPKTDLQIIYNLWAAIPQITTKTATLFIEGGYHISDIFTDRLTKVDISLLQYTNGTIIGKRADKIIKIKDVDDHTNYKHYCNIIAEIPGVTKKTASKILLKANFKELVMGNLTIEEIASIKKTEKSNIGISSASKIYKFLVKIDIS